MDCYRVFGGDFRLSNFIGLTVSLSIFTCQIHWVCSDSQNILPQLFCMSWLNHRHKNQAPWLNCYKNLFGSHHSSFLWISIFPFVSYIVCFSIPIWAFSSISALISFQTSTTPKLTEKKEVVDWNHKCTSLTILALSDLYILARQINYVLVCMYTSLVCWCEWGLFGSRLIYRMMYVCYTRETPNKRYTFNPAFAHHPSLSLIFHSLISAWVSKSRYV